MIRQIAVAASIALLGMSGQAMAGQTVQLSNLKGSVLVNQNGRYVPVESGTALRAGDRLIAMDGGAKLVYANGCNVEVSAMSMATISDAPCAKGEVVRASYETAPGANAGWGNGKDTDFMLFAGFAILTAVVVAAAFSDDEEPTSP